MLDILKMHNSENIDANFFNNDDRNFIEFVQKSFSR